MAMICALVQNSVVVGVVELTEEQTAYFSSQFEAIVDCTSMMPMPQIGWAFNGQTISGTSVSKKITKLAMNQRFTVAEMLGLMNYVNANPASIVALLLQRLQIASFVDLSRTDTQAGVGILVAYGLITSERASIILNTIPTPLELYQG